MWGVLLRDLSSHLSEFQKKPRKTPNDYVDKEQSRFEPGTSHLPARVGLGWVVDFEANCPLVGPGPIEVVPSVGVFPRDPSPYLREFRKEKHGKLRTASPTGVCTRHLPSSSFERSHSNTELLPV